MVSLVIMATIVSFSASAQTTDGRAKKRAVAKIQQKATIRQVKTPTAETGGITVLYDEKAYKAKRSFEEMLTRRLAVDAEEAEAKRKPRKG